MYTTIERVVWTPVIGRRIPFVLYEGEQLYQCIGGVIAPGESTINVLTAAAREVGVFLIPFGIESIRDFCGLAHNQPAGTIVREWCYKATHEGKLTPSGKVRHIALFSTADMGRTTEVGRNILQWFRLYGPID